MKNSSMSQFGRRVAIRAHKRGQVMILVSLVMVFIMIFIGLQASDMIVLGLRGGRHWETSVQAFHAARTGLEACLLEGKGRASYVKQNLNITVNGSLNAEFDCEVRGRAECYPQTANGGFDVPNAPTCATAEYYLPKAGYGTAGGESCQIGRYNQTSGVTEDCNWNKIYYGESVSIPLYQDNGGAILNPKGSSLTYNVRFRTPVNPADGSRYQVSTDPAIEDEVVATWEISAQCWKDANVDGVIDDGETESCVMFAVTDPDVNTDTNIMVGNLNGSAPFNEFVDNVLNTGAIVLNQEQPGKSPQEPQNLLRENKLFVKTFFPFNIYTEVYKPTLKISYIGRVKDNSNASIPYLEYQVEFNNFQTGDTDQVIFAEGVAQTRDSYTYHMLARQKTQQNTVDFVIQN